MLLLVNSLLEKSNVSGVPAVFAPPANLPPPGRPGRPWVLSFDTSRFHNFSRGQPGHIVRLAFGSPNLLISVFPFSFLLKRSLSPRILFSRHASLSSLSILVFFLSLLPWPLRGQPGHIVRLVAFTYPLLILLSLFSHYSLFLLLSFFFLLPLFPPSSSAPRSPVLFRFGFSQGACPKWLRPTWQHPLVALAQSGSSSPCRASFAWGHLMLRSYHWPRFLCAACDADANYADGCRGPPVIRLLAFSHYLTSHFSYPLFRLECILPLSSPLIFNVILLLPPSSWNSLPFDLPLLWSFSSPSSRWCWLSGISLWHIVRPILLCSSILLPLSRHSSSSSHSSHSSLISASYLRPSLTFW